MPMGEIHSGINLSTIGDCQKDPGIHSTLSEEMTQYWDPLIQFS